jgi:apolipoprotein N-acyltransferase
MLLIAGAVEKVLRERRASIATVPAILAFISVVGYGQMRIDEFGTLGPKTHKISIIQGNIPIFDKHAPELFRANIAAYSALGSAYETPDNLIVWPETVIMTPVPADNLNKFSLSFLSKTPKWLVGAVTLGANNNVYNSAISLSSDDSVSEIYHKLILMPFGEYVPFSKTFPWLLDLAHMAGELTPGDGVKNLHYPATDSTPELRVAPLICYEDVVTELAREAVSQGANLLVNMTNDAWFGDTVAPFQHNLLASFRAIENRRYLVRASNTGLSSVINPLGETTLYLKPFSEGVLSTVVEPLEVPTPYSTIFGSRIGWGLSLIGLLFSGIGYRKRKELVRCHEEK